MRIRHSRPWVGDEDIAAVAATLRSGHLSAGEQVKRFETELAGLVGQQGGAATSSGTAALHLALLALGAGEGDGVPAVWYALTAPLNAAPVREIAGLVVVTGPEDWWEQELDDTCRSEHASG